MTLPHPETPLVYSLHYAQERQDWEDELPPVTVGRIKGQDKGKSNLRAEEDFSEKVESMNLDPRLTKLIHKYQEVFGALPPPLSCKKLVQMDLKLKPEFEGSVVRRRPYPAPQNKMDEMERQIQECIDAGLVEEYKHETTPAIVALVFWLLNLGPLLCAWSWTMGRSKKRPRTTQGVSPTWKTPWRESLSVDSGPRWISALGCACADRQRQNKKKR